MPDSPSSTPPNSSGPKPAPVKVFIEGRYRKLSRDLPQTKFYCPKCKGKGCPTCEGFGKLTRDSVQELLAWVAMPRFKARRNKFHGAGREDMDVRMLGEGRPFVFEVLRAKNPQIDLEELAAEVNRRNEGRLELTGLRYSNKKRVVELKEMRCAKEYRALVACELPWEEVEPRLAELAAGGPITLIQTTPQRVAHRRAHLDRERWIELLAWERAAEDEEGSSGSWAPNIYRKSHDQIILIKRKSHDQPARCHC